MLAARPAAATVVSSASATSAAAKSSRLRGHAGCPRSRSLPARRCGRRVTVRIGTIMALAVDEERLRVPGDAVTAGQRTVVRDHRVGDAVALHELAGRPAQIDARRLRGRRRPCRPIAWRRHERLASALHGPHQEAQKLRTTTFPRSDASESLPLVSMRGSRRRRAQRWSSPRPRPPRPCPRGVHEIPDEEREQRPDDRDRNHLRKPTGEAHQLMKTGVPNSVTRNPRVKALSV